MVYRPKSLLERLELLRQYGADLTQWRDLSLDDYLRSRTTRYAVERLLFLVAGTVLDMLDHVLSARHEVVSDSYEEIVTNARTGTASSHRISMARYKGWADFAMYSPTST